MNKRNKKKRNYDRVVEKQYKVDCVVFKWIKLCAYEHIHNTLKCNIPYNPHEETIAQKRAFRYMCNKAKVKYNLYR